MFNLCTALALWETHLSSLKLSSPLLPLGKMTCRCRSWGLSKVSFVNVLQIVGHTRVLQILQGICSLALINILQEIWVKVCGAIVLLLRKGLGLLPALSSNLLSSCFSFEVAEMTCAPQTWAFSRNRFAQWFSETLQICGCAWGVGRNKAVSYINNAKTSFALSSVLTFVPMMQDQWQALLGGSGWELGHILHCPDCLKGRKSST